MLIYDFTRLEPGGLYLFFPAAAPSGGLWGIFERHDRRGGVLLAVCSSDLRGFELWSPLPSAVLLRLNGAQGPAVRFPL